MKKWRALILAVAAVVGSTTSAETVRYEFSFTGADLMSFVTADGADGSTAASNGVFDGARLVRRNLVSPYTHTRSYVDSQNEAFEAWADSTTDRLYSFNLWGLDGRGAFWGDDYKPTAWVSQDNSAGWSDWQYNWPASWGSAPAGYITDEFIGWNAATFGDALAFGDANNATTEFSFVVDFDTTNMFWGANTNGAPNTLPQLTFWFGGYMGNGDLSAPATYESSDYIYEGNMVLTGTLVPSVVPVPAAAWMGFLGIGMIAARRRLKKA